MAWFRQGRDDGPSYLEPTHSLMVRHPAKPGLEPRSPSIANKSYPPPQNRTYTPRHPRSYEGRLRRRSLAERGAAPAAASHGSAGEGAIRSRLGSHPYAPGGPSQPLSAGTTTGCGSWPTLRATGHSPGGSGLDGSVRTERRPIRQPSTTRSPESKGEAPKTAAAGARASAALGLPGLAFTERPPPLVFARDETERDRIITRLGCERGKENLCRDPSPSCHPQTVIPAQAGTQ